MPSRMKDTPYGQWTETEQLARSIVTTARSIDADAAEQWVADRLAAHATAAIEAKQKAYDALVVQLAIPLEVLKGALDGGQLPGICPDVCQSIADAVAAVRTYVATACCRGTASPADQDKTVES